MAFASRTVNVVPAFALLGMVCGLAAGPILSVPSRVLEPETRAVGMGLFYTVYYIGMMIGAALGGRYAAWAGTAEAAFDFGAAMLLACPIILWVFGRIAESRPLPARLAS